MRRVTAINQHCELHVPAVLHVKVQANTDLPPEQICMHCAPHGQSTMVTAVAGD